MIQWQAYIIVMIVLMFISGVLSIIAGAIGMEKDTKYDFGDVIKGLIIIGVALIYLVV